MNDLEFGTVKLHLKEIMEERGLSLSKLSFVQKCREPNSNTIMMALFSVWILLSFPDFVMP